MVRRPPSAALRRPPSAARPPPALRRLAHARVRRERVQRDWPPQRACRRACRRAWIPSSHDHCRILLQSSCLPSPSRLHAAARTCQRRRRQRASLACVPAEWGCRAYRCGRSQRHGAGVAELDVGGRRQRRRGGEQRAVARGLDCEGATEFICGGRCDDDTRGAEAFDGGADARADTYARASGGAPRAPSVAGWPPPHAWPSPVRLIGSLAISARCLSSAAAPPLARSSDRPLSPARSPPLLRSPSLPSPIAPSQAPSTTARALAARQAGPRTRSASSR